MLASYLTGCSNQVIIPGSAVSPSNATDSENVDSANSAPLSDSGSVVDIDVVSSGSPILGADGVHRLSNTAYAATIEALTGYELSEADLESLPDDPPGLFENNYERQEPSKVLIDSHLDIAKKAAEKAINTPAVLSKIVPCDPANAIDKSCFHKFIRHFGKLAFRRPMHEDTESPEKDEVAFYDSLLAFAEEDNDFYTAVSLAIQAMVADPKLVYRIEAGESPNDQTIVLDRWELLSKLSFFLWGGGPDAALIKRVAKENIKEVKLLRQLATDMLDDPRAHKRFADFHAMWLGYREFEADSSLHSAMLSESAMLIKDVLFDSDSSWYDVFLSDKTFVNAELAGHYQLAAPANKDGGWVTYADSGRKGILSHGTFLTVGTKFGRTSPIFRGLEFMDRVLCRPLPPPSADTMEKIAEKEVAAHELLGANPCNADLVATHTMGSDGEPDSNCFGCHAFIDGIGMGLESYGALGEFRTFEEGKTDDSGAPRCPTDGKGNLPGFGEFSGPGELAQLVAGTPEFRSCMMTRILHFATGRSDRVGDKALVASLGTLFEKSDNKFKEFILNMVTLQSFREREVDKISE